MFALKVTRTFSAAHALLINGRRETLHGHDWRVTLTVSGASLDKNDLLVDFHEVEELLDSIIAPFQNANLNEFGPFADINPSAERVAEYIARAFAVRMPEEMGLESVAVTEAPGCEAFYRLRP